MLILHAPKFLLHFTPNSCLIHKPNLDSSVYYLCTSKQKHVSIVAANSSVIPQLLKQKDEAASDAETPQNSQKVVSFLKANGFSKTQLEKVIETWPKILTSKIENNLKPKFKFFKEKGFTDSEIAELFSKDPWILSNSLSNTIAPAFAVLRGLLGSNVGVRKLLMISCWFLKRDLEKSLVPNVDCLLSCGVEMDRIRKYLYRHWRFFLCNPETMKQLVDRAERLGADRSSVMFLEAVRVVSSMAEETCERKLRAFLELGFSEDDIRRIFVKAPTVFALSMDKVNGIKEALLATGKYTMKSIVSHPKALTYSVEKRYKPRLSILEVLEHKKLIEEWPTLTVLYSLPDEKFFERFVAPHANEIREALPESAILILGEMDDI